LNGLLRRVVEVRVRSDNGDRNSVAAGLSAQRQQKTEAADAGHPKIQQNGVRSDAAVDEAEGGFRRVRRDSRVPLEFEDFRKRRNDVRIIVDNEDEWWA
jgi:hypothetical protein